jgi:exonuclease III
MVVWFLVLWMIAVCGCLIWSATGSKRRWSGRANVHSSKTHPLNIAKGRFWEAALSVAEARLYESFLLVGDWNTGAHHVDEKGNTYVCAEHFGNLSALGWTDVWRHHNPGTTEWTWYSTLKGGARGNGFRLDTASRRRAYCRASRAGIRMRSERRESRIIRLLSSK